MKIHNIRAGFATNSSSSHSVLIMPGHKITDSPALDGYGWDNFTLASQELKRSYLASQLGEALGYDSWTPGAEGNAQALAVITEILGPIDPSEVNYVDHQSTWGIPFEWDGVSLHAQFVRELSGFLDRDEVVVLGGNDNSDGHPLEQKHEDRVWSYPFREERGPVARYDRDHWTLFNRGSGAKTRLSFERADLPSAGEDRFIPSIPELVDLKITDYCPFGCSWCYQSSTRAGKHATMTSLRAIAKRLGDAEVFEVAIGGGEPTLHPKFVQILELFRGQGVIPNFTTRNLGWLRDPELTKRIHDLVGSFAYSAHSPADVTYFASKLKEANWPSSYYRPPVVHIVMGTVARDEFVKMLKAVKKGGLGVTLLGWKRTGLAQDQEPEHPYLDWWLDEAKGHAPWRLAVDTALAAEAETAGQLDEFPDWSYHTRDGVYSGYIDAVAMTMAPSSWEPERGSWTFDDRWLERWWLRETPEQAERLLR